MTELPSVAAPLSHLFQTEAWAEIRRADGWRSEQVEGPWGSYRVLVRPLPLVGGTLVEAPYGPPGPYAPPDAVRDLLSRLAVWAREARAALVRIHPYLLARAGDPRLEELANLFGEQDFRPASDPMGYAHTYTLDLTRGADALWAGFASPARRAVKKSERMGVTVMEGSDLGSFTPLYEAMAARTGLTPEPRAFFERLEAIGLRGGHLCLLEAHAAGPAALGRPSEDTLLAGLLFSTVGRIAVNLWGASVRESGPVRANVRLQWEAIRWACRAGLELYDLGGFTPDAPEGSKREGIGRYKKQYGGDLAKLPGTYALVLDPWAARATQGLRRLKARLGALPQAFGARRR